MVTRTQTIVPIAVAAFIVGLVGILTIPTDAKMEQADFPVGMIRVDDTIFEVQIADTQPLRSRGLMFQEQLPSDEGMLFVFEKPGFHSFWMLNMQFPLDMIWFDSDGKVVYIAYDVQPCKSALETATCTKTNPDTDNAQYVLEITAGLVEEYGFDEDSILELISI